MTSEGVWHAGGEITATFFLRGMLLSSPCAALLYSVKKVVVEKNMTWDNIWKNYRIVECRYASPEGGPSSFYVPTRST